MSAGAVARGALVGGLAVVAAVLVGVAIAWLLAALGLTETDTVLLGSWLAGLGLLGGWQQLVTSDVAGGLEWSTWAAGAPLLVTGAAAAVVASLIRRMRVGLPGIAGAALGTGGAAAALVALSQRTLSTANEAGRVDVSEGLTWWWTGGLRPGTVTGAVALVVLVGLVDTVGARWWRGGRAVAYGVVVVPGLLITLAVAAGAVWLTSSAAVGVAVAVLYPLLGSAVLLAAGGAPGEGGLTRITPEPYVLSTWSSGLFVALGALAACLVVAGVVGLVLRVRRHSGSVVAGVTATSALAALLTWAMTTTIDVPESLGGLTRLSANPLASGLVAAVMAGATLLVRGRRAAPDLGRQGRRTGRRRTGRPDPSCPPWRPPLGCRHAAASRWSVA